MSPSTSPSPPLSPSAPASASPDSLSRWDARHWSDWVVPAVVASLWALLLAASADAGLATRRGLVFVGGPVVLLAGLHARITGYLHAASRLQLLVLPLRPRAHFAAARRRHISGLALTLALGTAAVLVGLGTTGAPRAETLGMALDWAALAVVAAGLEPLVPGVSSALGRRFAPESWLADLQRRAGGGWTLPETVVHLYAPALGIGLAAAWAMPLQLAIDVQIDGGTVPTGLWLFAGGGVAASLLGWIIAPRLYARGVFEAVPFLAEATRTLAGPPIPEETPATIAKVRDPVLRLLLLSFWRETPVPMLRLAGVVGSAALVAFIPQLGAAHAAVFVAACVLWLVPATTLARSRPQRARMLATLPIPAEQRAGRHRTALALLWTPAAAGTLLLLIRLGGAW